MRHYSCRPALFLSAGIILCTIGATMNIADADTWLEQQRALYMSLLRPIQIRRSTFKREVILMPLCALLPSMALAEDAWDSWPPRDYLLRSLVTAVPKLLAKYHPETGRFGTEPWVYQDQMPIYPLSAAWSIDDVNSPARAAVR